jgi:hypothetical protein
MDRSKAALPQKIERAGSIEKNKCLPEGSLSMQRHSFGWVSHRRVLPRNRARRWASFWPAALTACISTLLLAATAFTQTAQTGALTGVVTDQTGRLVPGVTVTARSATTGVSRTAVTQSNGKFLVALLPPDVYKVEVSEKSFKTAQFNEVKINITETATLNVQLQVGSVREVVEVSADAIELDTSGTALGHITDQQIVESTPLVTRNYTQILGLSPGVSGEVNNSASIGRGDSSQGASTGGYSVGGNSTNDNNFQLNGSEVNDLAGEGNISGGIPVPNPDAIQEFKVQVGQYDASYGRNAGANVDVVTKSGTNQFHGDVWEFFRNTVLNANDYLLKEAELVAGEPQQRGVLNENQFGFTFGGPVIKDRLMFFVSYQGTRQRDGLDPELCLTGGNLPVGITNAADSRTASALASEFNGDPGELGGVITSPSDISPTALALLNAQLPNGSFLVPAPAANSANGFTSLSSPCRYTDDQFVSNVDFYHTSKSHFSGKFFFMDSDEVGEFPTNQLGLTLITVPGFSQEYTNRFRDFALTHTYTINDHLLNQAIFGYHRLAGNLGQNYSNISFANSPACSASVAGPISLTNLCVPNVPAFDNLVPNIDVVGGFNVGGNGQGVYIAQNFYDFNDSLTYVRGKHSMRFGGGINRSQINFPIFHYFGGLIYPSVPDFLLGNILESIDVPGVFARNWRVWEGNGYFQDNYQISPRLTLNLGFRYERQGQLGDIDGRASTFDPAIADPNPPGNGTLQGFIVGSNFPGTLPAGVIRAGTNTAIHNDGQNAWEPRIGFAWQMPGSQKVVLRGGYGIFITRTTSEPFIQLLGAPPWGEIRQFVFPSSSDPLPPAPAFPIFTPYSPTTDLTPTVFSVHFRPPILQRYSMGVQTALSNNWMLEVGYQGARGTKLLQNRSFNQALSASPSNPIRGQTSNDLANLFDRVPIEGFDPAFSLYIESAGASWYNALGASISRRFSHGLEMLASYTWASALETNPAYSTGAFAGGSLIGDQNSPRANYGFDNFIRPQRLVVSYVYEIPGFKSGSLWKTKALSGWSVAGVTTFQSGHKLTITDTNSLNAFGIYSTNGDRVQLASGCTNNMLVTHGPVTSKLNNYFDASCFIAPPVVGSDGLATGFGDSGNGIVSGPAQQDFDISAIKKTPITESKYVEFRAEFFNAFNTPSFADPSTNAGTVAVSPVTGMPTLQPGGVGQITTTAIAPRVIQFALKLYF